MKIGRFRDFKRSAAPAKDKGTAVQENTSDNPLKNTTATSEPPKKRALLIGINYERRTAGDRYAALNGPHADVRAMRDLLMGQYEYLESEIVVMLDEPGGVQPTRNNILNAIGELISGARHGDRFFFHYCGHTTQVANRSNSEEDGMDECLVPADGETNKIMDNELRHHLIDPLPVGSSLVAVFDSCHSASLLDLAHFRCNRVYVPWRSKGRRRSDERWNRVVRRLALPPAPPTAPPTPAVSRKPTREAKCESRKSMREKELKDEKRESREARKEVREAKRQSKRDLRESMRESLRELKELVGVMASSGKAEAVKETERPGSQPPTQPSSPLQPSLPHQWEESSYYAPPDLPTVTTRRIYEAARTSATKVRAWKTEVDALEVDVGGEPESAQQESRAGSPPAGEADIKAGVRRAATEGTPNEEQSRNRATIPAQMSRPPSRSRSGSQSAGWGSFARVGTVASLTRSRTAFSSKDLTGRQRRTTVVRSRAVSVSVRAALGPVPSLPTVAAPADGGNAASGAGKENVGVKTAPGVGPRAEKMSLRVDIPGIQKVVAEEPRRPGMLEGQENQEKRKSWLGDDVNECESPEPVWECQGWACRESGHGHELEREAQEAEVISLASCKDSQLSWETAEGGSMTRELVRILERDPHPTLRTLVTNVSHAMHRMSLERHLDVRRYKREYKEYLAKKQYHDENLTASTASVAEGSSTAASNSRTSTLSPNTPHASRPPSRSPHAVLAFNSLVTPTASQPASAVPSPTTPVAVFAALKNAGRRKKGKKSEADVHLKTFPAKPQAKAKSEGFVDALDMDNFQDPQVASHRPLNMERQWVM